MANSLVVEEAKIREDIEYSMMAYSLEELDTVEEIKEGIEALNNRSKRFTHMHVDLKTEIPDYNAKYHDFGRNLRTGN